MLILFSQSVKPPIEGAVSHDIKISQFITRSYKFTIILRLMDLALASKEMPSHNTIQHYSTKNSIQFLRAYR
jgi:hypothetical protein